MSVPGTTGARESRPLGLFPLAAVTGLLALQAACTSTGDAGRADAMGDATGCPGLAGETISWIVPYTPGGGYDVMSRLLEPFLEKAIGAEIVVRNRPGAGGLVGVRLIRDADPDGRTLGIVNATGMLVLMLEDSTVDLDPARDLTILGRVAVSAPVIVTRADSPWHTIDDVLHRSPDRDVLYGVTDVAASGFVAMSVGSGLLGLDVTYLAGYPGSRENALGVMRGEVDLAGLTFESIRDRIAAGDLRPLLQISDAPISDDPSLRDVPLLGGPEGMAVRRARALGHDPEQARSRAEAVSRLFDAGRLAAAPAGLDPDLTACLRARLAEVGRDSGFVAAATRAGLTPSFAQASEVLSALRSTEQVRAGLATEIRGQIERVRSGR